LKKWPKKKVQKQYPTNARPEGLISAATNAAASNAHKADLKTAPKAHARKMTDQNPEIDPTNPEIGGQNNPGPSKKTRQVLKKANHVRNNRSNPVRRARNVQNVRHVRNKNHDRSKLRGLNKDQDPNSHLVPSKNQGPNSRPGPIKIRKRTNRLKRGMAIRHHALADEAETVGNRKVGDQKKKINNKSQLMRGAFVLF
jgi:hypothetical protein